MSNALVRANPELALTLSRGDLTGYIQAVNSIPMLSAEEEKGLRWRWCVRVGCVLLGRPFQGLQEPEEMWNCAHCSPRVALRFTHGY